MSLPWDAIVKIRFLEDCVEQNFLANNIPPLPPHLSAMFSDIGRDLVIEIASQVPSGLGFGSSAALCVAVERALVSEPILASMLQPRDFSQSKRELQVNLETLLSKSSRTRDIWQNAHQREKVFHGNPSGVDTALVSRSGTAFLSWADSEISQLPYYERILTSELHLVVAAVPRRGDTKLHVQTVAKRLHSRDSNTLNALDRLGSCSQDARKLMTKVEISAEGIGMVANTAQSILADLGLSHPAQDHLIEVGRSIGACGGKLSGAGCGGAFFLVCPDAVTAERVKEAIQCKVLMANQVIVKNGVVSWAHTAPDRQVVNSWLYKG